MTYYFLFSLIGVISAFIVTKLLNMPKPSKKKQADTYIAGAMGMLIGMKIPVYISYGFSSNLIFDGKSFMGGILGAFIAINIYKYFSKQNNDTFGGRFVVPLAVAAGFGKIGCFMNGCCGGDFFIPPQIIESSFHFLIAILLFVFYKRTNRIDLLFPIYILAYLIMRFLVEFIRIEPKILFNLSIYQILGIIFIPVFIFIIRKRLKNDRKSTI